jgi:hypothetical protein
MYQSAWCVAEALDSIRGQSLEDFEALIVNDGSIDEGPAIAEQFARGDPRFRVIHQPNRGLAAARNTGLDAARGEFVYFLDADDRLRPGGLEWLVARADRGSGDAVYARVEWIDAAGRPTGWAPMLDHAIVDLATLLRGCPFSVHAQLIRRETIRGVRFDPTLRVGEDWDFWLRLSERGVRWRGFDRIVASYRLSPGSLSRDALGMWRSLGVIVVAAHRRTDFAEETRRAVLNELAIEWATASAASGKATAIRVAVALLREAGVARVDPRIAASKAFHRLPWMRGVDPACWARAGRELLHPALALWSALEAEGLAEPGFEATAMQALSTLAATPTSVARELASLAAPGPAALVGLGRNARHVACALDDRGIPFIGTDESREIPPDWMKDFDLHFSVHEPGAIPDTSRVILTMTHDGQASARWSRRDPLRWSVVQRSLADRVHSSFAEQMAIVEGERASV